MKIALNLNNMDSYKLFLKIKSLPRYSFSGRIATVPDEYIHLLGISTPTKQPAKIIHNPSLFDYQKDIVNLAIKKQKFAAFWDCGLGKTLLLLEFVRHGHECLGTQHNSLIVSPLMVIRQTLDEAKRFYGNNLSISYIKANQLNEWLHNGQGIGITNYEAITADISPGRLGLLALDESSLLKSHYGKWGTRLIKLGKGLEWKLCLTGTPAPNDRIEYANHAVFLDAFPTVNSFLARFFINRGQTNERWELKSHALKPFYRSLSHWSHFLVNPATYGWKDNTENIPPIHTHIEHVELSAEQRKAVYETTGQLFVTKGIAGGITKRSRLGQIGKGFHKGRKIESSKSEYIKHLVSKWPDESSLVWCIYNPEQDSMEEMFPNGLSIRGETPYDIREEMIAAFKTGENKILISKGKVLGFGLNLQRATRQVFSGLQDSYETFYQCVKRSNRYGATRPLNVHIPVTEIEVPMVETVLQKAQRVQRDTDEQEAIFREVGYGL